MVFPTFRIQFRQLRGTGGYLFNSFCAVAAFQVLGRDEQPDKFLLEPISRFIPQRFGGSIFAVAAVCCQKPVGLLLQG
jgi:hypothetical protein